MSFRWSWLFLVGALSFAGPIARAETPQADWVARSNEHAKILLEAFARLSPEGAGQMGVEGYDEQITDLTAGHDARARAVLKEARKKLKTALAAEKDPLVREDLEIMIHEADQSLRGIDLSEKYELPYHGGIELVYHGVEALLDDQVAPERQKRVVKRLARYAGLEPGTEPIMKLSEARTREKLAKKGLLFPPKAEVDKDLANTATYVAGIGELLTKYKIAGADQAYAALKSQSAAYEAFVRAELLPKARTDFRLPRELYAFELTRMGVDIPPAELARRAHAAFDDIQKQMQALAPEVAAQHKLSGVTDYRDVIRALKKEQLEGDAILAHYRERLAQIEEIVRREKLLTLPARAARIRLATPAEAAAVPAPQMRPPRLLGNQGEQGEFVLPLRIPAPPGSTQATEQFDDFTFRAASWTLTAHEARPGHELQFASVIERGVSVARAIFSFNSVNVEGWGLYAESITLPFMPPDGKLISLQHRLMRAARAFLDPELQAGKITPEAAREFLTREVVLSPAMANQEVERYTFRSPGQATSYFYGYTQLVALRGDVEKRLGAKFDAGAFHDFVLAQGLLPPALLKRAVFADFAKKRAAAPAKPTP